MAKVTVLGRVKIGGQQPYGDVIWDKPEQKIRPGVVIIKGVEVKTDDITYYLRYTLNGKQQVDNVGKNAVDAVQTRFRILAELSGATVAPTPTIAVMPEPTGTHIAVALTEYVDDLKLSKRPHKSIQGKQSDIARFLAVCPVLNLEDIQRQHILRYQRDYREGAQRPGDAKDERRPSVL